MILFLISTGRSSDEEINTYIKSEKEKKNDIEIPYDDILKVHVFVEQNSLIIETTDLNSYALDLYDKIYKENGKIFFMR